MTTKKNRVPRSQVRRALAEGQFRTRIVPAKNTKPRRISGRSRRDVQAWMED